MAKRHNIDTIAEVLIDKMNDMERTANRIERASSRELKIDTAEMKALLSNQRRTEESILNDLKAIKETNSTRVPNWVLGCLIGSFFLSFGFIYYAWSKAEAYDEAIQRANYFEQQYNQLKK